MHSNEHVEINFLIKAFARFYRVAEVIPLFEEMYGKKPTPKQLALTDLGRFLTDKRPQFQKNHRVKRFKMEREKAIAELQSVPIADASWRMGQYQNLYEKAERKARETGNTSRCTDILVLAAKDAAGFYEPKTQNVTIDNRVQNIQLSDEEINKRLSVLLKQFNVNIPDMPLIEKGAKVIEYEEAIYESEEK